MIGIFHCGGDVDDYDYYDDDYDDSLGGDSDDLTLCEYRGRDDRSAAEEERMPTVEELGDNLRAVAMRRITSQRVTVNALHGGRLSSGSVATGSSAGRLAKRRGGTSTSSIGMDSGSHQVPEYSVEHNLDAHVALAQVYTVRRPQSFIRKQQATKSPGEAPPHESTPTHKSGIPKEICIEIEPELEEVVAEQRTTQERREHQLDNNCEREPVEICDDSDDEEERQRGPEEQTHEREPAEICDDSDDEEERQREPEEQIGLADPDASQDVVDSISRGAAISNIGNGATAHFRPPLPAAAKSTRVRVRIHKPLGIVFESPREGSVRIVEMPLSGNAARCGRLAVGDELFFINGKSMKHRSFDFVMEEIAAADPKRKLDLFFRRKNAQSAAVSKRAGV